MNDSAISPLIFRILYRPRAGGLGNLTALRAADPPFACSTTRTEAELISLGRTIGKPNRRLAAFPPGKPGRLCPPVHLQAALSWTTFDCLVPSMGISTEHVRSLNNGFDTERILPGGVNSGAAIPPVIRSRQDAEVDGNQGLFSDLLPNQLARIMRGMPCAV